PVPESRWQYTHSIGMIQQIMEGRMFPMTLRGIEDATRELSR
ncbi:MAG: VWA domain-containing protein, partial [Pseudomonadota bacterium]